MQAFRAPSSMQSGADRRDKPLKRLIEALIERRGTGSPRQIPGWRRRKCPLPFGHRRQMSHCPNRPGDLYSCRLAHLFCMLQSMARVREHEQWTGWHRSRRIPEFLGIDPGEFPLALRAGGKSVQKRREDAARSTPFGPEVDKNGDCEGPDEDLRLETSDSRRQGTRNWT